MNDSITDRDVVILLENRDVPEHIDPDPFEDGVAEEIVLLDVMRLELADIELL